MTTLSIPLVLLLHTLFWSTGCSIVSAFSAGDIHRAPKVVIRLVHQYHLFTALSASTGEGEELLEKARRLRDQAQSLEATKKTAELLVQQQKEAMHKEEQQRKNEWKDRYSVIVPILKDMKEEVMERVDFSPRIKGGAFRVRGGNKFG